MPPPPLLRQSITCLDRTNKPDVVFGLDRNSYQTHYRAGNGVHAAYLNRRMQDEGFFKSLSFKFNPLHNAILSLERKTYEGPAFGRFSPTLNMVRKRYSRFYRHRPQKIEVVHNGIDLAETEKSSKKIRLRTPLPTSSSSSATDGTERALPPSPRS